MYYDAREEHPGLATVVRERGPAAGWVRIKEQIMEPIDGFAKTKIEQAKEQFDELAETKLEQAMELLDELAQTKIEQALERADKLAQIKLEQADELADTKIEQAYEKADKLAQTKINNIAGQLKAAGQVVCGTVAFVLAARRLVRTLDQLMYGPEVERATMDIMIQVDMMLEVRQEFPLVVVHLLEEIQQEAQSLAEDIKEHYRITNGIRAAGAVASMFAGGFAAAAGIKGFKGADAGKFMKAAGGLGLGAAALDAGTHVADWCSRQRLQCCQLY
eukprot:11107094-Heterocapsa_arctica.AAC.1